MQRSESVKVKITKTAVEALESGERIVDTDIDGFMARRLPSGAITYGFRYRLKGKPQRWVSLGVHGRSHYTADRARKDARALAVRVENREDPYNDDKAQQVAETREREKKRNTVNVVLNRYLEEIVRGEKKLRTAAAIEAMFDNHVREAIGAVPIAELERDDLNRMLKTIAKGAGPVARDRVLANVRAAFNWYEVEDSKFRSPIVKGMARGSSKARKRILNDDEIRTLWTALQSDAVPAAFADLVRNLLYTGQRRGDSAEMHDREIKNEHDWIIPAGRYKNQDTHYVYLTPRVLEMLPKTKGFKFGVRTGGERPYSGFSKGKAALDKAIAKQRKAAKLAPMEPWTLHDLRRTARSLMSRAKVSPDIAERVIGHTIKGVRKVYDIHTYAEDRKDALERLSNLLDAIIDPPAANVIRLDRETA
jgi:integrase